jgi:prepilin-type N-terminal cleavage/methylation domain-containing protein
MQTVRTAMQHCPRSNVGAKAHIAHVNMASQSDSVRRATGLVQDTEYDMPEANGGFTIIEILIVIVIIAIAAMTVVPMMSSAASMQVRSAANMIAADLEYAKSMAISRGQYFSVVFDKTTESYRIEDQNGNVIPHPVEKGSDYSIDFRNDGRLDRVDIVDADFDATNEVKFDYLGSPYSGGGAPLNSGVINLRAGSITKTITVEAVTGYISIAD